MLGWMCLYIRLLGSLGKNLLTRLASDLADCLAAIKRCLVYKLCGWLCGTKGEDDVFAEEVASDRTVQQHRDEVIQCQPLPDQELISSVSNLPWFHDVDRKMAQEMVYEGGQGCFLVRPSGSGDSALTLTLWHRNRPFNIIIRQREDCTFALGSQKDNEPVFASVEELIKHYHMEELILFSRGERSGRTLLTSSPVNEMA